MKPNHLQLSDDEVEALALRRLRGELAEGDAARLAAALAAAPRQAELAAALERAWAALELPESEAPSVAPALMARLRREAAAGLPLWAQWAAAAALVLGVGAGWGLGKGYEPPEGPAVVAVSGGEEAGLPAGDAELAWSDDDAFTEPGLGESLWLAAGAETAEAGEAQ